MYFRKFVAGLGAPEPNETPLATDSKSARDTSYNPEHHDKIMTGTLAGPRDP